MEKARRHGHKERKRNKEKGRQIKKAERKEKEKNGKVRRKCEDVKIGEHEKEEEEKQTTGREERVRKERGKAIMVKR